LLLDVGDIHVVAICRGPCRQDMLPAVGIFVSVERFEEISLFEKVINRSKLKTSLRLTHQ
jgi:hypothetical protein